MMGGRNKWIRRVALLGLMVLVGIGCSSQPEPQKVETEPSKVSDVLEEVKPEQPFNAPDSTQENPVLSRLTQKMQALGYEVIGLQFETNETLLLLESVFDSPVSQNRQIRIVYTGVTLSYDAKHRSLTIGGTQDTKAILKFIEKNVPLRASSPDTLQKSPVPTK